MLEQKRLRHPRYCSRRAQRPLQAQLTCVLARQRRQQGCSKPSNRDTDEGFLLLGHFLVNRASWPCSIGPRKCLVNSRLVEAQSLTVNMEGIEKELKGHCRCQAAADRESVQPALQLRRTKCWGRFCASTGEITRDNKINLPGQCKLKVCL